jgi:hypothetical protein
VRGLHDRRGRGAEGEGVPVHPFDHEPISPELVLVDPELAARVRPFAVAGPTFDLAPEPGPEPEPGHEPAALRAPEPPAAPLPEPPPVPAAPARRPERRSGLLGRVSTACLVLATLALLGAAFLPPRDAPRLTDASPPAIAAPRPTVTLAWKPAGDADYYLVEIYRGERLVHAESVRTARVVAPDTLSPGRYTWRVFAGRGAPTARSVRGPLENGWFVVRDG